jgi:hypothetical protein
MLAWNGEGENLPMVAEFVIDTNVWVMIDKDISKLDQNEVECVSASKAWLKAFVEGEDKLAVDEQYRILKQIRENIPKSGSARSWLNKLESQPRDQRLREVVVEFDKDDYAVVPENVGCA